MAGTEPDFRRQAGPCKQVRNAGNVGGRKSGQLGGESCRGHLADGDGFAMQVAAVTRNSFQAMADGVAKIQNGAQAGLGFVLAHHVGFDLAAAGNDFRQGGGMTAEDFGHFPLQPFKQGCIVDDAVLDDLGQAGPEFAVGQPTQGRQIAEHQARLVESADQIFAGLEIDAHFPAHGTVHLGEQGGGHLDQRHSAQVGGGDETRQIPDHATAQRHDERLALHAMGGELIVAGMENLQTLGAFPRRHENEGRIKPRLDQRLVNRGGKERRHVRVREDGATGRETEPGAMAAHVFERAGTN